ncbi:aldo/keto reductase [Tistrella mobilis]|uniref:aldo/keto reductase n=1 Tax=Tistrella mobilis TaxID=171437 RepID=UPI0035564226
MPVSVPAHTFTGTTGRLDDPMTLPALGLGCMGMSDAYGPADRDESIATIHAALDAGIFLLDTGDFYGQGHNELLIREALWSRRREDVFIAVKFGALRDPEGRFLGFDSRPAAVKNALAYTLKRLGTDYVDLYQPARLDPAVPIEDTVGAVAEMIEAGYVRHLGLSEVSARTLERAAAVHPVRWLQIEYSVLDRGIEASILPAARRLGTVISAYGVLGRGLLSSDWAARRALAVGDYRAHLPRFSGDNLERNLALTGVLHDIAAEREVTATQIAIAWVAAQGPDIVPLIGARRRHQLAEAIGALDIRLSSGDLARIRDAIPADATAGTRYTPEQMRMLDSETGAV